VRRASGLVLAAVCTASLAACATSNPTIAPTGLTADAIEVTERQVLVTLRPAPAPLLEQTTRDLALVYNLRTVFAWPMGSLGERCVVFEVPAHRGAAETANRLALHPAVSLAQPIQVFEALAEAQGSDPYLHLQHAATALNLVPAHRYATGAGVRVAIVDTGVDVGHPDLRGRVAKVGNFVDRGEQTFTSDIHGTAVAGAIAAAKNDVGIVGVAPNADLYALKACWPQPPGTRQALCNSYTLARAVDFAILEGVQILNFSLSGPEDPLLGRLVQAALQRGISVVAARPAESTATNGFPASAPGVLAVAGSDLAPERSASGVDGDALVRAPGVDILTTAPNASYDFFSGSSLSAAQVSGVLALLLERRPQLSPAERRQVLLATAHSLPGTNGAVIVDACAAVASVTPGAHCD
jgi:subtilisin family serine protease